MSTPAGFVAFSASNIRDVLGNLLAVGSLEITPTDGNDIPIDANAGGAGGPLLPTQGPIAITNGALPAGLSIADTAQTVPGNICYRIVIFDATGVPIKIRKLVQTNGAALNLDTYAPPGSVQQAPYTPVPGLSAYQVYLASGGTLSQSAWLSSLTDSPAVKSTADLALFYASPNSTVGTLGAAGAGSGATGAGQTYILQVGGGAIAGSPWIESISLNLSDEGTTGGTTKFFEVLICQYNGESGSGSSLTIVDRFTLANVVAGQQTVYAGVDFTPRQLKPGQYLGFYSVGWGVFFSGGGSGFPSFWYSGVGSPAGTGTATNYNYANLTVSMSLVPSLRYGVPSTTTVRTASSLGCQFSSAHDDGPAINAFLATATAANPVRLIMDGLAFTSGVSIPTTGNVTIEGVNQWSTGLQLIPGSYRDLIRIGTYSLTRPQEEGSGITSENAQTAINVTIRNLKLECDGNYPGVPANQPISGAPAHSEYACILFDATNVLIENVLFVNPPAYCLCLQNVSEVRVVGCRFQSGAFNQDGIHIDGPANNILIHNCAFTVGDDSIALNAPEGYGGNIDNVIISNCRFDGTYTALRMYPNYVDTSQSPNVTHQFQISRVLMIGCEGTVQTVAVNLGLETYLGTSVGTPTAQIEDLHIASCNFTSLGTNDMQTKAAALVNVMCPVGLLKISNTITRLGATFESSNSGDRYPIILTRNTGNVGDIVVDGLTIVRNGATNNVSGYIVQAAQPVARIFLRGIAISDQPGQSYGNFEAVVEASAAVGILHLDAIEMQHFTALMGPSGFTNLTTLHGAGVLGTGTQIPDAAVDNNTLYLNSAGKLGIKIAGVAKTLSS